jgi:hypothetical protein
VAASFTETQEELFEASDITQQETQPVAEEPQAEVVQEQSTEEQPVVENVPTKYKGKSLDEIIKMHQEAEKLIGRQAQEVGEVRKLADELIKRQLDTKPKAEEVATKEDEIDFFEDPKKYVNKAVEQHPAVKEAKEQAFESKKIQVLNRLQSEFPDFEQTVTDPAFAEWIKASPVRTRLYAAADASLDYDSAAELLNTWTYVKPKAPQQPQPTPEVKAAQKAAVKAATVDVGSNAAAPTSAKVYRRADLIRLQLEDPDRYYQLQDEIMAAYASGRVK